MINFWTWKAKPYDASLLEFRYSSIEETEVHIQDNGWSKFETRAKSFITLSPYSYFAHSTFLEFVEKISLKSQSILFKFF